MRCRASKAVALNRFAQIFVRVTIVMVLVQLRLCGWADCVCNDQVVRPLCHNIICQRIQNQGYVCVCLMYFWPRLFEQAAVVAMCFQGKRVAVKRRASIQVGELCSQGVTYCLFHNMMQRLVERIMVGASVIQRKTHCWRLHLCILFA